MKLEIYRKANDLREFDDIVQLLIDNNIEYLIEETPEVNDQLQINYNSGFNFFLRINPSDKSKVDELSLTNNSIKFSDIPKDYHLFDFENDELLEVITFKNEWSQYDFIIAGLILKERGINPNKVSKESITQIRIKKESETEPSSSFWISVGYASAILGGLFGFIIGLTMWFSKKTILDGSRIYDFSDNDRKHGKNMTILSVIFIIVWIIVWRIIKN